MHACNDCGTLVTERFARVFGDNDNEVNECINCATWEEIAAGAAGRE